MFIYFVFILVYAFMSYVIVPKNEIGNELTVARKNKLFLWLLLIGMTLLMGLRDVSVGRDILSYQERYTNYIRVMQSSYYSSEFGFNYMNYLFNKIGFSWQLYLVFVSAFISCVYISFYNKYSKNLYISFFLFITAGSFAIAMSAMRQTLAICLCMVAFMVFDNFQKKNKNIKAWIISVIIWLIAISFHNSAVVFILFFFLKLLKLRLTRGKVIIGIVLVSLSLLFGQLIINLIQLFLPNKYANISLSETYLINPLIIVISILIPLFCVLFTNVEKDGKYSRDTTLFFIFSMLNILFTCVSINQNQIGRLVYYFSYANAILIPLTFRDMSEKDRLVFKPIIMILFMVYFYLGTKGDILQIDNYLFFWQS